MLKISTRVTLTPQRSASRWIFDNNCALICSRDEKVSSSVMRAMMLRNVACVNSSTASGRFCAAREFENNHGAREHVPYDATNLDVQHSNTRISDAEVYKSVNENLHGVLRDHVLLPKVDDCNSNDMRPSTSHHPAPARTHHAHAYPRVRY